MVLKISLGIIRANFFGEKLTRELLSCAEDTKIVASEATEKLAVFPVVPSARDDVLIKTTMAHVSGKSIGSDYEATMALCNNQNYKAPIPQLPITG